MHIYGEFYAKDYRNSFLRSYMQVCVSKYWNRVANMRRKPTCIFILSGKPSAVLKLLE